MSNKFAAFTVLSVLGVFNVILYVLFINPAPTFPYMTLGSNDNCTSEVQNRTVSALVEGPLPSDLKFLERMLMQTTGENCSQPTNVSVVTVVTNFTSDNLNHTLDHDSASLEYPEDTNSTNASAPIDVVKGLSTQSPQAILQGVSAPLKAPPVEGTTTAAAIPASTVNPPRRFQRIDPHNFTYLINQPKECGAGVDHLLLVFVCTSLQNFDNRRAIRETWGSIARQRRDVHLLFLLGTTNNRTLQEAIALEATNNTDIVQEDFLDTYYNLTLKSVMLLKWVDTFCPGAKFLLKTDDDMFIHIKNLLKYLAVIKKRRRMLFGRLVRGAKPLRSKTSKWYAPPWLYRERVYPDYLSGTAYAMSTDVARALYSVAVRIPLFHLEDVFVTGICARKAGIPRRHHNGFAYERRSPSGCAFKNAISGHRVTPQEMHKIWDELQMKNITCK